MARINPRVVPVIATLLLLVTATGFAQSGRRGGFPQPTPAPAPAAPVAAASPAPTVPAPTAAVPLSLLQQPAREAQIAFSGDRLSIHADNASLTAILRQIAASSGMHITGLGNDERVFGTFGPGAPRDVLADLLNGTAYNVVLLGDLSNGAPRELILTPTTRGGETPGASPSPQASPDDASTDQEVSDVTPPPPPEVTPVPSTQPPPPGAQGVRTPQQLFEQLQQMRQAQQQLPQPDSPSPQQ